MREAARLREAQTEDLWLSRGRYECVELVSGCGERYRRVWSVVDGGRQAAKAVVCFGEWPLVRLHLPIDSGGATRSGRCATTKRGNCGACIRAYRPSCTVFTCKCLDSTVAQVAASERICLFGLLDVFFAVVKRTCSRHDCCLYTKHVPQNDDGSTQGTSCGMADQSYQPPAWLPQRKKQSCFSKRGLLFIVLERRLSPLLN